MDPTQVDQVLMNLVVNARDAMPQGGQLTIETANVVLGTDYAAHHVDAKAGEHLVLTVTDTGIGMDEKIKAHIFEPFFTTKDTTKGTGLGLATVYGIVRQSGGHIECDSQVGKGSTFRIYLPRGQEQKGTAADDTPTPASAGASLGMGTILVVEDETSIRDLLADILTSYGYQILAADGGVEALRLSAQYDSPIHLLVTDVVMPNMSGRELADRLRSQRPDLRVLYISGYTDKVTARYGLSEPGVAFLPKPFNMVDLLQQVTSILDREE
jgi:CheY-like chemotaxis protein